MYLLKFNNNLGHDFKNIKLMEIEFTAYVFIDELQSNSSRIIFGRKYEYPETFPVIEVEQKSTQDETQKDLLRAVRVTYPHARISIQDGLPYINIP